MDLVKWQHGSRGKDTSFARLFWHEANWAQDSELNTIPIREPICGMRETKGRSRKVTLISFLVISLVAALQVAAGNEEATEGHSEVSLEDVVSRMFIAGFIMIIIFS